MSIQPGFNGELVLIRNSQPTAVAIARCYERRSDQGSAHVDRELAASLAFPSFRQRLIAHLAMIDKECRPVVDTKPR